MLHSLNWNTVLDFNSLYTDTLGDYKSADLVQSKENFSFRTTC